MKQIVQNLKNGKIYLEEVPAPLIRPGHLTIQTTMSLVSAGTERMLVEFGRANLITKVRQQPDKVREAFEKVQSDGVLTTAKAVLNKLEQPIAMGYCNVGTVVSIGDGIEDIRLGDRVVSNGPHAELVCVPRNLAAHIPANLPDEAAVFTVPSAIALNGIRQLDPRLGETVVVIGLGLIGILTLQLLRANGCEVIGVDIDSKKLAIVASMGFQVCNAHPSSVKPFVAERTAQTGADRVIITTASSDNGILENAATICRKRGSIVLVGTAGLHISRQIFYEKEIIFSVASSYGPGRYDSAYESKGLDYPLPYVRWTANRNFQAALDLLKKGALNVSVFNPSIRHLNEHEDVYNALADGSSDVFLFKYIASIDERKTIDFRRKPALSNHGSLAVIGAGNYVKSTLLPLIKKGSARYIISTGGISGSVLARKYRIPFHTTDLQIPLQDPAVSLMMICSRHDSHAKLTVACLRAGKHVFVEKPLAISENELTKVIDAFIDSDPAQTSVTVGFNRRFSPYIQKMKSLARDAMVNIVITVNAGALPATSWVHDRSIGGGRIIGEMCHFIDLMGFLAGSPVKAICSNAMGHEINTTSDNLIVSIKCQNGSAGTVNYFSNGSKSYSKERIEMYFHGKTLVLDNFQFLRGYGFPNFSHIYAGQDKGHAAQFSLLTDRINQGGLPLIPFEEIVNTTRATFAAVESLKSGNWVNLQPD